MGRNWSSTICFKGRTIKDKECDRNIGWQGIRRVIRDAEETSRILMDGRDVANRPWMSRCYPSAIIPEFKIQPAADL